MCLTARDMVLLFCTACTGMLVVLVRHCMWAVISIVYISFYITLVLYVVEYWRVVHVLIVGMMTYICYCVFTVELDPDLTVDV